MILHDCILKCRVQLLSNSMTYLGVTGTLSFHRYIITGLNFKCTKLHHTPYDHKLWKPTVVHLSGYTTPVQQCYITVCLKWACKYKFKDVDDIIILVL